MKRPDKYLLILVLLMVISQMRAHAQVVNLRIVNDAALDSVINRNIEINRVSNSMEGYRIQIFSGSDRKNANALKTKFKTEFADEPVYLIYQQPYFKLRVGDFRNMIEAQALYYNLLKEYGQVLIVPDRINYPKL